jgi:hypothetical protein
MKGIKNSEGVLYIVGTDTQMKKMLKPLGLMYPKEKFHISMLIPKNPNPILGKYKRNVIDEKYTQQQLPFKEEEEDENKC